MKKTISFLLIAALALSLAGCGAAPAEKTTPAETAAPAAEVTAAPAETAEPEGNTAPDGRLTVAFAREAEELYSEDGAQLLLSYACVAPTVAIAGRESAAAAVNAALEDEHRLFAEGEPEQDGLSGKEEFLSAAREEYDYWQSQGMADNMTPYQLQRQVLVTRGDDRVLSLLFTDVTYTGGAHGYVFHWAMNFDTLTGEPLTLADLAEDPDAFLQMAGDMLLDIAGGAEYAMRGLYEDYRENLPNLLRDGNWYFDDEGLVVIANAYEIGPYAEGAFEFTLPWEWLKWQLKEEYVPHSTADGTISGEIREDVPADAAYTLDDGTDGQGAVVAITARGRVEGVALERVTWSDSNIFWTDGTWWYVSALEDGETLCLRTWIPEIIPSLAISRREADGKHTDYISQSGRDGSLVLLPERNFLDLPLEASALLPLDWDIDGDGERETLDLRQTEKDGASFWQLTVNGKAAPGGANALDGSATLWLCDLDFDGVTEIFFSGDAASDDYVTCGWHGDTREPILFAGEDRTWLDPEEPSAAVEGRAVISGWNLVLERWNYQLGTYCAIRPFQMGEDGVVVPDEWYQWEYRRNTRWLTVKGNLSVTMDEVGRAVLLPGEEILLVSALGTEARFVTRGGEYGVIELEYRRNEEGWFDGWYVEGVSEEDLFDFLPYTG